MNKKKQKNFIRFSAGMFDGRAKRSKSFLVLFFKKELLAFYFICRRIENPKKRLYPQISQINADFGANSFCVNLRNLRINNSVNQARILDAEHKSWMPAFAGMTGWGGWGQRWIASLRSQ